MSVILLCGVPGSGKTTLANNLKKELDSRGIENIIVTEPQVEAGTFDTSANEGLGRSEFKEAILHELSSNRVLIADGMNFIKGFRYELFCSAREAKLGWCVAYCECDPEEARVRSLPRYPNEKRLVRLIGRMEVPRESQKWDKPLFVVKDPNDPEIIAKIINSARAKSSKLIPKKATTTGVQTAHISEQTDQIINEFCSQLLKIQKSVPIGTELEICGAKVTIRRIFNDGQLRRARREFGNRAKGLTEEQGIVQLFADGLELIH